MLCSFDFVLTPCSPTSQLGSPFRAPLMKFALKFPQQTVEYFLSRLFDSSLNRVFRVSPTSRIIIDSLYHYYCRHSRHKDGGPLRDVLAAGAPKIIQMTFGLQVSYLSISSSVCVFVCVSVCVCVCVCVCVSVYYITHYIIGTRDR